MNITTGPRGSRLIFDRQPGIPLVSFQVAIPGGSAGDPPDLEGFTNHMASLARRGAGTRDRRALDEELDGLGASLSMGADRDSIKLSGVCLVRNIDRVIELSADILAAPRMDQHEHEKLLRETRLGLDEARDDDSQLVARYFHRHCVPGHPYARSVAGTEASLARIERDAVAAAYRRLVVPQNLIIGISGDIDHARAEALAARLVADLPDQPAPPLPSLESPPMPRGRRLLVIDKPERTQSQIYVGHMGPRYGTDDALALILVETVFGGMFTSRLMQEIRVKRGWSYGAGCSLYRSRGEHWFRIHLAPPADVAPDALTLTLSMLEDLAENGITADELAFAHSYLSGSLPFRQATARQRVRIAVQSQLFGLPADYIERLPERLASVTLQQANDVARRRLHPGDALSVIVATADTMLPRLASIPAAETLVQPFDAY